MVTRKTPGQALVEQLDEALPPGVVWTKIERVTLGRIEVLADRLDALGKRADAAVRTYLHAEAKAFLNQMVSILIEDGPEFGRYSYDQLWPQVHALESGQAVLFSRFELPPGHPMSAPAAGHPSDTLELDEDNVIRPVPS